jgi:hypothetical protein
MEVEKNKTEMNETPPFGQSWNKLYAIVLGELLILILFFYFFTKVLE